MRRLVLLLAVAALLGTTVVTVDAGASGPRARAMKLRLKPFGSCKRLVHYARHYAPRELRYSGGPVVAPGIPPPFETAPAPGGPNTDQGTAATPEAAPPPAGDSSQTNVQEQGVDEPDFVKSDGKVIFAIAAGRLNAVDARAATPKLLGSIELDSYGGVMLLLGDRLLVFSNAGSPVQVAPPRAAQVSSAPNVPYYRPATLITEIDVSDPAAMRVVRTETIDGSYVSARLNGAFARVVLTTPPAGLDYGQAGVPLRTRARGWLPRAR
ncbi:MAG: hypothetical protein QOF55_2042, partial [Thermoleophilaceae bacterium]|nr:hypothetical protein [Thermoleophilaceae bacterium]